MIRHAAEEGRGHAADADRDTERDTRGEPDVVGQVGLTEDDQRAVRRREGTPNQDDECQARQERWTPR